MRGRYLRLWMSRSRAAESRWVTALVKWIEPSWRMEKVFFLNASRSCGGRSAAPPARVWGITGEGRARARIHEPWSFDSRPAGAKPGPLTAGSCAGGGGAGMGVICFCICAATASASA